jgi:hypothetical protein
LCCQVCCLCHGPDVRDNVFVANEPLVFVTTHL